MTLKWLIFCLARGIPNSHVISACGTVELVKNTGVRRSGPYVNCFSSPSHKQFVKALSLDSECFQHLVYAFPGLSCEKIKVGVFDGSQIHTIVRDQEFVQMNAKEKAAWLAYEDVIKSFLGNKKAQNYDILVSEMLFAFRDLGNDLGASKSIFCSVTWTNSQKTLEPSVTNRESDSTRTS